MNENNWHIDIKNNFAHWYVYGDTTSRDSLWSELRSLLNVIFQYGALSKLFYSSKSISKSSEVLFNEFKISKSKRWHRISKIGNDSYLSSIIDVYQNNKIVSKEVSSHNVKTVLKGIDYYPQKEISKIDLSILNISCDINEEDGRFTIGIHVNSDIFFPYVLCPWKWKKKYDDNDDLGPGINELDYKLHGFNNKELSNQNGSRLNLMLKGIMSFVEVSNSMRWDFHNTEHLIGYHKMTGESGIILDSPIINYSTK